MSTDPGRLESQGTGVESIWMAGRDTRGGNAPQSSQDDNWVLLRLGLLAGLLMLVSGYFLSYGVGYSVDNDGWRIVFTVVGVLTNIALVWSILMCVTEKGVQARRFLRIGVYILVVLLLLYLVRMVTWSPNSMY